MLSSPPPTPPDHRYRGQLIAERKAARRQQLIDGAIRVFGRDGFRAATVRSICTEAGLTQRYLYESFDNTEQLFIAAFESIVLQLRDTVFRAVSVIAAEDAAAQLRAGLDALFQLAENNPAAARVLMTEVLTVSREVEALSMQTLSGFVAMTRYWLMRDLAQPSPSPATLDMVATGLVGATLHMARYWAHGEKAMSRSAVVEQALQLHLSAKTSLGCTNAKTAVAKSEVRPETKSD